jgi:hypothetical protein
MASELEVGKAKLGAGGSGGTASAHADELLIDNNGNTGITIASGASDYGGINFSDSGNNSAGIVRYDHSNDSLKLYTQTTERLAIDSNGLTTLTAGSNGVDDETLKLAFDLSGTSKVMGSIGTTNVDATNGGLTFKTVNGGTLGERLTINSSGVVTINNDLVLNDATGLASIKLQGGAASAVNYEIMQGITGVANAGFSIYDTTNAVTRMSISASGLATFSNGINLGNETLSVYRKGTFAPGLYYQNGSGVTIGGTAYASHGDSDYIKQVGQYVKVGNVVHIQIFIEAAIAGSIPNDNLGVQGLPFTSQNVTDDRCVLNAYTNGGGSVNHAIVSANSTVAVFETINGSGNLADDVGAGSNIRIHVSGTYITS